MSVKNFAISVYIFCSMVIGSTAAAEVIFHQALPCDGTLFVKSPEEQLASNSLSKVSREHGINIGGRCLGWTNAGGGDIWYTAVERVGIFSVDISQDRLLGVWPLTRSPHQYSFSEIRDQYGFLDLEYPLPFDQEYRGPGLGCLGDAPFRHIDLEQDGSTELAVILNNLLIIFSPDFKRTIFSEYLDSSDWLTDLEMADEYGDGSNFFDFQYASKLMANNNRFGPALRAYSKLYFGDFDKNGNPDILVWRSLYKTNGKNEPQKGFSQVRELYQHYERDLSMQETSDLGVTGEYLPMDTDSDTVSQWLQENALTWQKGYPSESECQGRQGQLIPESHDPLLNDVDVLD